MEHRLTHLKAVRDLLSDRRHWTRGMLARNANGNMAAAEGGDATCWCLEGAIKKVVPTEHQVDVRIALCGTLAYWGHFPNLPVFNDNHEHRDVVYLLDETISQLEKRNESV